MRKPLLLAAKILVSVVLLYVALRGVDLGTLARRFNQINPGWILAAVGFGLLQISLGAARWRVIATHSEAPLGLGQALHFSLIGTFFNQALPSSIGGDAARVWLLARTAGWRAATYSVLVDRGVGMIALSVVILVGLPWSYELITSPSGRTALLALDAAAFACGAGFILFGLLKWPWLDQWWPTRHLHAIAVVAARALFDRRSGPILAPISIAIHLLAVLIAFCAARSIAAPLSLMQAFLLVPSVMLVTMLPISIAGWGLREATMMTAFGYAGLAQTDGLLVSLLYGATLVIVGFIGGLVWIFGGTTRIKPVEADDSFPTP
jgi:uncharacterized membrane protein YbhN (UPF0104 family)